MKKTQMIVGLASEELSNPYDDASKLGIRKEIGVPIVQNLHFSTLLLLYV